MKPNILFENFEMLADAPNGVPKLREMILQLAIQGKLVHQDPKDEPASDLLEKIKAEKKQLIREKKIKKTKPILPITPDEIPHELPGSWEWTKLAVIGLINPRNEIEDGKKVSFIPMKLVPTVLGNQIESEKRTWKDIKKGFTHFAEGDVAIAKITPCFQNRKSVVMRSLINGFGAGTTELHIFRSINEQIIPEYVLLFLKTPKFIFDGVVRMTGSAGQKRVPKTYFSENPFPLPPLNEQKRIVAKVDQLMALCDELETRKQKRDKSRIALNDAALDRLLSARKQKDFTKNWKRISNSFNLLYDTPETVDKLRQAILQLAVQGKLVPQDPKDLPASVLVEKIKAEKERLIKEKKIKKTKPVPPITPDEIPYELPDGWEWVRLGNALLKLTDGTHHSPYSNESEKYKYVTAKNIKNFGIDQTNLTYVTKEVHKIIYKRCDPEYGDILYIKDGATTGIVTINNLDEQFSMLSSVALLKLPPRILNRFLLYVMRSPYYYKLMRGDMSGVAITRVTLTKLGNSLIPVAPFSEQKRIANEIDKFMTLCDDLEKKIYQSRSDCDELLNTIVSNIENVSTRKSQIIKKKAITKKIAPHPRTHQYP